MGPRSQPPPTPSVRGLAAYVRASHTVGVAACGRAQCDYAAYFSRWGQDISSANCTALVTAITFNNETCFNPCVTAFWQATLSMRDNGCADLDAVYMDVTLASLTVVCGNAGGDLTCGQLYASVGPVWTCGPVSQLGCCWSAVLTYVQAVYGTAFAALVENAVSPNRYDCSPDGAACGILKPNGAGARVAWSAGVAAGAPLLAAVLALRLRV